MLNQELPPEWDWFRDLEVGVDWGYQGIPSDYQGAMMEIPPKQPRTSQANPAPEFTAEPQAEHHAVSQVRRFVEHAIGGMKRFNILVQRCRHRKENLEDVSVGICAGLWNLN